MGITWRLLLLLSLGFFHRVTSLDATATVTAAVTTAAPSTAATVATTVAAVASSKRTPAPTAAGTTAPATTDAHVAPLTTGAADHHTTRVYRSSAASTARATAWSPAAGTPVVVEHPSTLRLTEPTKVLHTQAPSKQPTPPVSATPSNPNVFKSSLATDQPTAPASTAAAASTAAEVKPSIRVTAATTPTAQTTTTTPTITTTTTTTITTTTTPTKAPRATTGPGAIGTTRAPTTTASTRVVLTTAGGIVITDVPTVTATGRTHAQLETFTFSLQGKYEEKKEFAEVCRRLMVNMESGSCTLKWHNGSKVQFHSVEITGSVKTNLANQHYEELTKKATDNKTLIAILASCGALLIMIIILAVCASHHRKPYNETQQHLTEELHTVENGYHDNPTLEVMEVQPEMQEKKMALNGEFNDSWIVPIDNLLKEDMPDEEDTHL